MSAEPVKSSQVLGVSACLGFLLGAFGYACWQHAVEGAQVVAGIVQYPDALSPFGVYQKHVWTLLHQIPALLLKLGFSEIFLCVVVSGVQGALSFSALGLGFYILSRDAVYSCLLPFVIFYSQAYYFGLNYPVFMMGVTATYGTVALLLFLLITVMFSAGYKRISGILLGLLASVHPPFALLAIPVFFGILILNSETTEKKNFFVSFLAGLFISGISLLGHVSATAPDFLREMAASLKPQPYLPDFIRLWDSHRQSIPWFSEGNLFVVLAFFLSLYGLKSKHALYNASQKLLLRFFLFYNLIAMAGISYSHLPPDRVPAWLLALMPARFTSISIFSYLLLTFGLLRYSARTRPALFLECLFISALLLKKKVFLLLLGSFALLLIVWMHGGRATKNSESRLLTKYFQHLVKVPLYLLALYFMSWEVLANGRANVALLLDRTNDAFYEKVSQGSGYLLLGPGTTEIQLLTRRPVLMDPDTLDFLPYVPQTFGSLNNIMKDIYGKELTHKNSAEHSTAMLLPDDSKALWESYRPQDWQRIRALYRVTEVLVREDWKMTLPKLAQNESYALYAMVE